MTFDLDQSIDILRRTPAALSALLGGLGDEWTRSNYGESTFSPFDVVGHLIHGERTDWMPRLRIVLDHGEARPFPPFDRYAMVEASRGRSMAELLATFAELRAANLAALRAAALPAEALDRCGTHPTFGRVTLRQLLAAWVVHDLGHTHQVVKAMAYQYRDAVGPWRKFLTILPQE